MLTVRSGAVVASFHDRLLAQAWLSRNLTTSNPGSYDDEVASIKDSIHKLGVSVELITQSVVRSVELLGYANGMSCDRSQTRGSDKPGSGLRNACAQHSAASFYDDERFSCSTDAVCQPDLQYCSFVGMGTTPSIKNMDAVLGRQMNACAQHSTASICDDERSSCSNKLMREAGSPIMEGTHCSEDGYMSDPASAASLHPVHYCIHEDSIGVQAVPTTKAKGCQATPARREKSTQTGKK